MSKISFQSPSQPSQPSQPSRFAGFTSHRGTAERSPALRGLSGLTAVGLLAASLVLAGCGRKDDTNADVPPADSQESSERSDMGGTVSQQAEEVRQDVVEGAQAMADGAREVAGDVKQAASEAVQTATDEMSDASITASVNAELAKDESLSALKINVDTQGGQVMLRGTAPTTTARERATTLAMAVKGVKKVDNQLTLQAAKP